MKKIILFLAIVPCASFAAAPSTSCPSGTMAINKQYMIIGNTSCPSGYSYVGAAYTCLLTYRGSSCLMYAPVNTEYTDAAGTYEYTAACPLE